MEGFISDFGMTEDFLSFVWRYQYFATHYLLTTENEPIQILQPGHRNMDSGPDFSNALIQLGNVTWAGNVEIHVRASDWLQHRHPSDPVYESVILHVVWDNDYPLLRKDGTQIPTLELKNRIEPAVFQRYRLLMEQREEIPCAGQFAETTTILRLTMLDKMLLERLSQKSAQVEALWNENGKDWEETAYQWMAQHYGFKLNAAPFLQLAQRIPLKVLLKHRDNLVQLEALLFGMAGLLPTDATEDYSAQLKTEYLFLSAKYNLKYLQMKEHEWKFLRLRPAGFPTIRLAQMAVVIQQSRGLFSTLTDPERSIGQLRDLFRQEQSGYWQTHYHFSKTSIKKIPKMGCDSADLLIINVVIPLMAAYSQQRNMPALIDKAIQLLEEIPGENNRIIREWARLGMNVHTAHDTQALLQWYNAYCQHKRCLQCTIGLSLLRKT